MADMKTAMKAKEEGKLALNTIRMARAISDRLRSMTDTLTSMMIRFLLFSGKKSNRERKLSLKLTDPEEKTWLSRPKLRLLYWSNTCRLKCLKQKLNP